MLLPVRLQDSISSERYHPGDTFTAVLDAPLVIDGLVLAEKGARVEGKVVESQRAGRVKGVASIALELTRLSLSDGQHVEITTDSASPRWVPRPMERMPLRSVEARPWARSSGQSQGEAKERRSGQAPAARLEPVR